MKKLYLFLMLAMAFFTSQGQTKNVYFSHLTMEHGLPENRVTALLEDKLGYIWVGTQAGLVRYNGYEMKPYPLHPSFSKNVKGIGIHYIHQDKNENIWIGTRFGDLFRYDKANDRFDPVPYKRKKQDKFYDFNAIVNIQEDNLENLWFVRRNQDENITELYCLNLKTSNTRIFSKKTPGKGKIPAKYINILYKDSQGNIWLGTENGLFKYNTVAGNFKGFLTTSDSTAQQAVTTIYEAPGQPGILWLGNNSQKPNKNMAGLMSLNVATNKIQRYHHPQNASLSISADSGVIQIYEDRKKRLWIGTWNGLLLLDRKSGKMSSFVPEDSDKNAPRSVAERVKAESIIFFNEDHKGNFWLTTGKGFLYFTPSSGKFERYSTANNTNGTLLADNNFATRPVIDRSGTFWFSAYGFGLGRLDNQRSPYQMYINTPGQLNSYPGGQVSEIKPGKDGVYWIASQKGLVKWVRSTNRFEIIPLLKGEGANLSVSSVAVAKDGQLWCGTRTNAVFRYNPRTGEVKNYTHDPKDTTSISSDNAGKLLIDKKDELWVGTYGGGLCKLNKETDTFIRYLFLKDPDLSKLKSGALDDDEVLSLYEDRKGNLWVGTNFGGINLLNKTKGTFTSFYDPLKEFHCVSTIYEDKKGRLWAGTYLWGLFLVDPKTGSTKRFNQEQGLLSNNVSGILEDNAGYIWISSQRGLTKIHPENFSTTQFTKANGLPEVQFTRQGIKDVNGDFILASARGPLVFNPAEIKANPMAPAIIIESLSYPWGNAGGGEPSVKVLSLTAKQNIELQHNENRVTFNYVGLHYDNAALNKYQFQLEGYDKGWVQAGGNRTATYTNLSPGTYTFKVKAANADGVWNTKAASVTFTVLPPWWLTWWAYCLYFLLFMVALRGYIVIRSRTLRIENRKLEQKVDSRTAELSLANESLSMQRDQLHQTVSELKSTQTQLIQSEKMASLGELTAGIAHEIQNPLNFVNNFSEVSVELLEELDQEVAAGNSAEALAISTDIKENLQKINHHGKRADSIVKGMLLHSRSSTGTKELIDINALADEYLSLSYHGLRAKDKSFNATLKTNFSPELDKVEVSPQDLGRVLLNLYNNAFYAVKQKQNQANDDFKPTISVSTLIVGDTVQIEVRDNGNGIPDSIRNKIMQPFFTTKPTGQGTGLGLSMAFDIITKGHGGELRVESEEDAYTSFYISLPYKNQPEAKVLKEMSAI